MSRSIEMFVSPFLRLWLTAAIVIAWGALQDSSVQTQQRGGTVQTDNVQPVNSGANPYRVLRDWAANPVHHFDESGKEVRSYRDGNVWVTDARAASAEDLKKFGRTSALAIDRSDVMYTADSESSERVHPGWRRGIRIGSLKDGKVTTFIPAHKTDSPEGAMGEGIAIDAAGNVYTAEANLRGVTKYVKDSSSSATPARIAIGPPA